MKSKGFTLIETLVVVALIGVVVSIAFASFEDARKKARDTKRTSDLAQIQLALEQFYQDNGYYPYCGGLVSYCCSTDTCGLGSWGALSAQLQNYMPVIPADPLNVTGKEYYYAVRLKVRVTGCAYDYTGRNTDYVLATNMEKTLACLPFTSPYLPSQNYFVGSD